MKAIEWINFQDALRKQSLRRQANSFCSVDCPLVQTAAHTFCSHCPRYKTLQKRLVPHHAQDKQERQTAIFSKSLYKEQEAKEEGAQFLENNIFHNNNNNVHFVRKRKERRYNYFYSLIIFVSICF